MVVQIPLPCVAAAISLSEGRYLIISVLTFGNDAFAVHTVEAPFSKSVSQTPVAVAIYAFVSVSGWNKPQRTGISGKLPSQAVQVVPPSAETKTLVTPKLEKQAMRCWSEEPVTTQFRKPVAPGGVIIDVAGAAVFALSAITSLLVAPLLVPK